jgi:hypothetical protein
MRKNKNADIKSDMLKYNMRPITHDTVVFVDDAEVLKEVSPVDEAGFPIVTVKLKDRSGKDVVLALPISIAAGVAEFIQRVIRENGYESQS